METPEEVQFNTNRLPFKSFLQETEAHVLALREMISCLVVAKRSMDSIRLPAKSQNQSIEALCESIHAFCIGIQEFIQTNIEKGQHVIGKAERAIITFSNFFDLANQEYGRVKANMEQLSFSAAMKAQDIQKLTAEIENQQRARVRVLSVEAHYVRPKNQETFPEGNQTEFLALLESRLSLIQNDFARSKSELSTFLKNVNEALFAQRIQMAENFQFLEEKEDPICRRLDYPCRQINESITHSAPNYQKENSSQRANDFRLTKLASLSQSKDFSIRAIPGQQSEFLKYATRIANSYLSD